MGLQLKSTLVKVFNRADIKTVVILGTLVIAALAGGAPSDFNF